MATSYEHLNATTTGLSATKSYTSREGDKYGLTITLTTLSDTNMRERINTTLRYATYMGLMLAIFVACAAFWGASRSTPLLFSLEATRSVENHPKAITFTWVLIGSILAFATGSLFNQLLKVVSSYLVWLA